MSEEKQQKRPDAGAMDLGALLGGGALGLVKPMLDEARAYEADTRYALKTIFQLVLLVARKVGIPEDDLIRAQGGGKK